MTRDELAAMLNGRKYRKEITRDENKAARSDGLIVVFGASDDLLEFHGVMGDEIGAYNGTTARVSTRFEVIQKMDGEDDFLEAGWTPPKPLFSVKAEWCPDGFPGSWLITTDQPHSTFDIMEDGELYCRGIVIDTKEIQP
jgi:hypothetical protein